ncbi:MAG: ABC transporter permease subunit [Thermoproteota archaeon]
MNRENVYWELKKLMVFPIPEIMIISMVFNGTIELPNLLVFSNSTIHSSLQMFVQYILNSVLGTFMIQGVVTGVLAAILFVYEREAGILDMELAYSRGRKELFAGKLLALFLASIIYVSAVTLILVVENLRGMWLAESLISIIFQFLPVLVQTFFIISVSVLISTVSEKSIISILSTVLVFYSLNTMSFHYNPEEIFFLSFIPPSSTRRFLIAPHLSTDALATTLAISIGLLLVAYICFTRFYEVR